MDSVLEQFRRFDKNGDGIITKAELRRVMQELDAKVWTEKHLSQLVRAVDKNGDGKIQFEEFVSWLYNAPEDQVQTNGASPLQQEVCDAAAEVVRSKSRAALAAAKAGEFPQAIEKARDQPEVLNLPHNSTGNTLLHEAAAQGNLGAIEQLLQLRGDPTIVNKQGQTPVDLVAISGDEEAMRLLKAVTGWSRPASREVVAGDGAAAAAAGCGGQLPAQAGPLAAVPEEFPATA